LERLRQLQEEGAHPVAAIKAVRQEFSLSLPEAKHLLSISPAWQQQVQANGALQEEAIAVAEQSTGCGRSSGT
jgi:ribosomal protein L7/L12